MKNCGDVEEEEKAFVVVSAVAAVVSGIEEGARGCKVVEACCGQIWSHWKEPHWQSV